MTTIVLNLGVPDAHARRRLEVLYFTMFNLRRALQRDAVRLCLEYWSRKAERDTLGWKFVADDLGLSRKGFERLAAEHAKAASWALDHVSAALVYHMADGVFEDAARHLWPDASGHRSGPLHITPFHEFSTIFGRARSHTTVNKWETFRLYGTLEGQLDAYAHSELGAHPTLTQVASLIPGTPVLAQNKMTTPGPTKWSTYVGPLVVVFAGGSQSQEPELQLPVRLPSGRGQWDRLVHFLSNPDLWHKIDLVRRPDSSQPDGWRYEMHLLVLRPGYVSPANLELLDQTPTGRVACVDVNVSNLSVVSTGATDLSDVHVAGTADIRSTVVRRDASERDRLAHVEAKASRGQRLVDRSRRTSNHDQYIKSKAQLQRDARRESRGLRPVETQTPAGARLSRVDGKPVQAYWRDDLSDAYRNQRRRQGEKVRAQSTTKKIRAHNVAIQLVSVHGVNWLIEDCNLTAWAKLWGKALHAFAPGMVTAELAALAGRHGGSWVKMATGPTALSSHCLCGRHEKKSLGQRHHACVCGFSADRDLLSAGLGTCVVHVDATDSGTARVDFTRAGALLAVLSSSPLSLPLYPGHQDALTSQTHPLVPACVTARGQGARLAGYSRRAARLNAGSTAQSTNGRLARPAKVAHGPALARSSPPGDLRLNS